MAIDNTVHKIRFARKVHIIYGEKYTWDMDIFSFDETVRTMDKTHDLTKL